ncbi:hypothetical protein [Salinibacter ruber]|uniref:hypothetical protein n=1 Tax=Salinibacter ruber TaxID=146919 RepID=UPI0021674585|nr:hypothetical protein [Salinibacter ruber]MCS3782690.1 DNA-directed RNA polymerase beta subunit [Salinibacter ruber]
MNGVEGSVDKAGQLVGGSGDDPNLKASKMLQGFKGKLKEKLRKTYTNSALSTTTETNNVLDIDNRGKEITIKGPGGIQSEYAIQPENIELHPSRLGLMDVVNTPTGSPGRSMPLANGAAVGEGGEIERKLYDREQGEERVVTAEEVDEGGIGFADDFERTENEDGSVDYTPKSDQVFAGMGDEVKEVAEEEVRYVMKDMTDMLADGTNIVPFINHNSGPRAIMGARQMGQGVSLEDAEAPLVDTVSGSGETFFERLGKRYNVTAKKGGTVKEIKDDAIVVEGEDGSEEQHPLFKNLALNQGGFIDHTPKVEEGDKVKEGDQMTTSNYTDDEGRLAIGKNLDIAYTHCGMKEKIH